MHPATQNIVKAHSCAVQISHRATLNQYRAWLVLLKNSMPRMGETSAVTHKMPLADLWREMGSMVNRHDGYLKNLLRGLVDVKVEWNLLGKDKEAEWGVASLLAGCRIRGGMVEWDYSAFLREKLHSPRMFALLNLGIVNRFSSKYALALYAVAADYKGLSATPFIPIEKYRQLMGLDKGEYIDFRALNRRLIKEPLAEINSLSDLSVSAEYRKECRRVSAVRFHVRKNPHWKLKPPPQVAAPLSPRDTELPPPQTAHAPSSNTLGADLPLPMANLLRRILKFGISQEQAHQLLTDYYPPRLRSNLELAEAAMQKRSLENPGGYLLSALKNDYAASMRTAKAEKVRRHREAVDEFEKEMTARKQAAIEEHNRHSSLATKTSALVALEAPA